MKIIIQDFCLQFVLLEALIHVYFYQAWMKIAIYKYQLKYFTIRFKINRKELSTVIKITLKIKLHIFL